MVGTYVVDEHLISVLSAGISLGPFFGQSGNIVFASDRGFGFESTGP